MNIRELKEYLSSIPEQDRTISLYFIDNGDRYYLELDMIDLDVYGHLEFNIDINNYKEDFVMSEYKKQELKSFIDDRDKMQDFLALTKEEFLEFYPHLTEYEYELTLKDYNILYGRD